MNSQAPTTSPAGPRAGRPAWPVRSGAIPPLAEGFSFRPETAPAVERTLASGVAVVLTCGAPPAGGSRDRRGPCGKTQLAVLAAESLWQARQVDLLVWVDATSRASVLSGYVDAARAVMGTELLGTAESVAARFVSWLSEASRPWLVVLDDLPDPEILDDLWPHGSAGAVLITTTSSAATFARRRVQVVPVTAFSTREALNYIMGRLVADTDQRLGAMALVEELGGEPLALAQAATVIVGSGLTCLDYRNLFARKRAQISNANGRVRDLPAAAITWTLSLEQADRLAADGAARLLLVLATLLGSHGIPGTVFATSAVYQYLAGPPARGVTDANHTRDPEDRQHAWNALLVLERTGLLALDPPGPGTLDPPGSGTTVWMSRAVQSAVQAALPDGLRDRAARAAADALLEVWPDEDPQGWLAGALRSCAASLIRATGDLLWVGGCHRLLLRAGQSLVSARLAGPATAYWRDIVSVSERVLGPDHPDTVLAAEQLADAYMASGQPAEAIPWYEWVLVLRVRILARDHVDTIAARRNLGHALVAAGHFRDAATALEQVISDYERVRGPDHPDTIGAREDLAAVHGAAAHYADAVSLYRRTLTDRDRVQGSRDPATLATRQKLADTFLAAGQPREARKEYKRVLEGRERALGPDHLDTIAALLGLGSAYYAQGKMASALQFYEQAATRYQRGLGIDHRDTLAARVSLATVYYRVGRLTDAVTLLRDTVTHCERVLPSGDPLTQTARESLENIAGG
jgi:tetratricopeptide (TPR) repeat protein